MCFQGRPRRPVQGIEYGAISAIALSTHFSISLSKNTIRYFELLTAQGRALQGYVQREFDDYLKCCRLECGFLRIGGDNCHAERLVKNSSL